MAAEAPSSYSLTMINIALCLALVASPVLLLAQEPAVAATGAVARTPGGVIGLWPPESRVLARAMIEKYGAPSRFGDHALYWYDNGPWKKTVVYRDAATHSLFRRGGDILEQTVAYQVSRDSLDDLRRFDSALSMDPRTDELSVRSESEARNVLTLNLAVEILTRRRTIDDARSFQRRAQRLADAGKDSPYLDGLRFDAPVDPEENHWNP